MRLERTRCDPTARPRHVRRVDDGTRNRDQQSVGEPDVEKHGGPGEEIIETGWNDDEEGAQEDFEAGRCKVELAPVGVGDQKALLQTHFVEAGVTIAHGDESIKKDWGVPHGLWLPWQ